MGKTKDLIEHIKPDNKAKAKISYVLELESTIRELEFLTMRLKRILQKEKDDKNK